MEELRIAPQSKSSIRLQWITPQTDVEFLIYRRAASGGGENLVQSLTGAQREWTDTGLSSGETYTYRLVVRRATEQSAAAQASQSPYSGPIRITRGGTYSGNWESLDANVPAVTIATTEPVVIENSHIRSRGDGINQMNGGTLEVRNSHGWGLNPNVNGKRKGYFVNIGNFSAVTMESNWIESYLSGIRALNWGAGKELRSGQRVVLRYNQLRNMDGRSSDGNGGYVMSDNYGKGQGLGLNTIRRGSAEIAWNEIINEPFQSNVEDVISPFESGGVPGAPMVIHHNFIQGGYPTDIRLDFGYSGAMINLGDCPSNSPDCAYVDAHDNRVVSFGNTGVGIAGGHHMRAWANRSVSAQKAPDGTIINTKWRTGLAAWNYYNNPNWAENYLFENYVRVVDRENKTAPIFYGPNNVSYDPQRMRNNTIDGGLPYQPQNRPLTTADERAEHQAWLAEASTAGVKLGPQICRLSAGVRICGSRP